MLPLFAQLGSLSLYTYGVFLMLGFFWACFFIWKHIRISKFEEENAFDITFISFGGALVIGRIIYCLMHFQEFGLNILKYLLANGYPGISSVGMLLGGVGTMYWACRVRKIKFQEFSDYIAPSLFVFAMAAELGAFIAGTEPGIVWKWFRHPVAFYKATLLGVGTYLSFHMFYNVRKEKIEKGAPLFFFLGSYSFVYVVFQFLRDKRSLITESPIETGALFILLLTSCFYFVYYFRVLIGQRCRDFINSKMNYVKTIVKYVSHKTEKHHRGGAEKTTTLNSKS
ncbi:MAG: prolipoprotein diacylglyceryl transferase family protein [bacterium]